MAQHSTNTHGCPVYIHPAAASNPATVRSIQRATGHLVVITCGRPQLKPDHTLPAFEDFSGFGGGAA
ncbi:hypothetical protein FQZ97_460350 [compost metagenome]